MNPALSDFAVIVSTVASFLASAALAGASCRAIPAVFKLTLSPRWRAVALAFGIVSGLALTVPSLLTFGWLGASAAAGLQAGPAAVALMMIAVPVSTGLGAALVAAALTGLTCGVFAGGRAILRRTGHLASGSSAS